MANQKMKISELADQVRDIPLCHVLERYGFEPRREGMTFRAKSKHHNIVVTGTQWFDNKANIGGGGAIDLVMHIGGVDFLAACRSLADQFRPLAAGQSDLSFPSSSQRQPPPEKRPFEELMALYAARDDSNWPIARAYLVEHRRVLAGLVDKLHACGSIYCNNHRPNPSLVFLHRDQHGEVCGATLRDTRHQSTFRPCLGNKLTAWFAVGNLAKTERVVAVESPIDALSYYSLFACSNDSLAVVSCAGATIPQALMFQAYHRCQPFVVALDNDPAGERGWVKARGETVDWMGFKLSSESPKHKDWNDDLAAAIQCLSSPKSKKSAFLKL
jgi:Toprim-like/Protein of unknown function (DUF3991)